MNQWCENRRTANFGNISWIASLTHSSRSGVSIWHVIVPTAENHKKRKEKRMVLLLCKIHMKSTVYINFVKDFKMSTLNYIAT